MKDELRRVPIGTRIMAIRKKRGLTQAALAEKAGLRQPAISMIENDERDPSWSALVRLADALGARLVFDMPAAHRQRRSEMTDDRNAWIMRRAADGYDWTPLVDALSKVVVHRVDDGLLVDLAAIAPEHWPTPVLLEPGPDGRWLHKASGEHGPLVEQLITMTLCCIEHSKPYQQWEE